MDNLKKSVGSMYVNPTGFGPGKTIAPIFEDQLFQPYYKTSDRAWHVSDWTNKSKGRNVGGIVSGFAFKSEEDASSFNLVEGKPSKPAFKRSLARNIASKFGPQTAQSRAAAQKKAAPGARTNTRTNTRARTTNTQNKNQRGNVGRYRNMYREEFQRESSIFVDPTWETVEEITFEELQGVTVLPSDTQTLKDIGTLEKYNDAFDRASTRAPVALHTTPVHQYTANASADPIIADYATQKTANIFASEQVLSLLMAAQHTVQPWDLLVTKTAKGVFIDSRPNSVANKLFVQETVSEYLPTDGDNLNSVEALANEATFVAGQFVQQVLAVGEAPIPQAQPSPAAQNCPPGEVPSAATFRYRKFDLGDNIKVLSRTSVAAYRGNEAEPTLVSVKVFNEFDSKVISGNIDWREKLDTQPGAVLAAEMKNNTCRVVRAVAETILSGADTIRIGWVTRANPKDNQRHQILGVTAYDINSFTQNVRVTRSELWGTLKSILEFLEEQEEGKYLLIRDPMRPVLKIVKCPMDAFNATTGEVSSEYFM